MNILIISNSFSGLYAFRKEIIETLIAEKHHCIISSPEEMKNKKTEYFKNIGCEIVDTNFNRQGTSPFADIKLFFKYLKMIKRNKIQLVLSYTSKPNIYGGMACRFLHIKQLANITGLGEALENNYFLQKIMVLLYKIGLKNAHTIFFQNEANRQFFKRHNIINNNDILIPGSGVNLTYHSLQEYPIDNNIIKFLFISRIRKEKGIEQYLSTASIIKEKFPNTEFHIVGYCEQQYYKDLIQSLQQNGIVIYHGEQEDVRPFIKEAHCLIHPTFYSEGMSNVLLESCAAGRPCITTDRTGCKEIIDDGVNGFIIKQKSVEDLVNKVQKFIQQPFKEKQQMGLNAREKVENQFDRNIVIKQYLQRL